MLGNHVPEWAIHRKPCWETMFHSGLYIGSHVGKACFYSVLCFVETGLCNPGCPQMCSIAEGSLDFLIFLPLPLKCWNYGYLLPGSASFMWCWVSWTWSFMHSKQELYKWSYIPISCSMFLSFFNRRRILSVFFCLFACFKKVIN